MDICFKPLKENDREQVLKMMRVFYDSPAVITKASNEVLAQDFDACLSDSPFIKGFAFICDGALAGYGMCAFSFSTELGGPCVWIEDIYILEEYRHKGIGTKFLKFVEKEFPAMRYRLEVEEENKNACAAYLKADYKRLDYIQLVKDKKTHSN